MAVGQAVLSGPRGLGALLAVEDRITQHARDLGRLHAALLRDVLALEREHVAAGMPLSTVPQLALLLRCSERRAGRLLVDALGLAELPGALDALEQGLLTVEQSSVVVVQLAPLTPGQRFAVWRRLLVRLEADLEQGVARPPARLTELLRRWVVEADADAAEQRRREAEQDRRVEYRRRDDGLVDLFLLGLRAPDAQAVLQRIRREAEPSGPDERMADQRRLDAARDLLLGRPGAHAGCLPGSGAPCGVDVQVHVPLSAALGETGDAAELVGHGAVEADLLEAVLLNAPRLTPVLVDERGSPVAVGRPRQLEARGDPAALREALLALRNAGPLADHGSPGRHRAGPGAYRVTGRLRRLLVARAPRCEFPGCGVRASRCDVEHDVAWPLGPSCPCNLGPCCRRHHRVKQEGWTKQRSGDGVRWTAPTGRSALSPSQHRAPAPVSAPHRQERDPLDELSPTEADEELWLLLDRPDDPEGLELRALDVDGEAQHDVLAERLEAGATAWSVDLDDPYAWVLLPDV